MVNTNQLKAAKKFPLSYFIKEQMALRSWSKEDLAMSMGLFACHTSNILNGKEKLTLEVAHNLGRIFNTSFEYWLNLDKGFKI